MMLIYWMEKDILRREICGVIHTYMDVSTGRRVLVMYCTCTLMGKSESLVYILILARSFHLAGW